MKRTGILVVPDTARQRVRVDMFEEGTEANRLSILLEPEALLKLTEQLIQATGKMDQQPDSQSVKKFLVTAVSTFGNSPKL